MHRVHRHVPPIPLMRGVVAALIMLPCTMSPGTASAASTQRQEPQLYASAAQEFGVPASVLLAVAYNESRWESHRGTASVDGGYGLMNLRTTRTTDENRGEDRPHPPTAHPTGFDTLDTAANLIHVPADTLRTDDRQNIRGAAAVLAHDARQMRHGALPNSIDDWADAVAQYSGATDPSTARAFVDGIYTTMQHGASRTTTDGERIDLAATRGVHPNHVAAPFDGAASPSNRSAGSSSPECPASLTCRFVPAAYVQDDPKDLTNYGNYDIAHRPTDMKIDHIVIHDTEGSYDSAISWFQNPQSYASAHYVIRSSDGAITQTVHNSDVAWGAGDWYVNMHSINIEHEGFASQGATWYTEAQYRSSATLVRYLAQRYHIPLDRDHIIGHDDAPTRTPGALAAQHWDPGPYWDWGHYMALLHGAPEDSVTRGVSSPHSEHDVITIAPDFAKNRPPITDCSGGACVPLPAQGTSVVYLHTQPSATAPLLNDPALHPDGSPGTFAISDWSATASVGEKYASAGQQGDWTGIWFGGQIGWLYNPVGAGRTADVTRGATITPRSGLRGIPVYGAALPEASAYPSTIPAAPITPLQYTIAAGQHYVTSGVVPTDYFYADTVNLSAPDDHTVVHGNDTYVQISFNHRQMFVNVSDVVVME